MRKLKPKIAPNKLIKEKENYYQFAALLVRLVRIYKLIFGITDNELLDFLDNKGNIDLNKCDYINEYWFKGITSIVKRYIRLNFKINERVPNSIIKNKDLKKQVDLIILLGIKTLNFDWIHDPFPTKTDKLIMEMLSIHILINRYIYQNKLDGYLDKKEIKSIKLLLGLGKNTLGAILTEMSDVKVIEKIKNENVI